MEMQRVRLLKRWNSLNAGEIACFPRADAEQKVRQGIAAPLPVPDGAEVGDPTDRPPKLQPPPPPRAGPSQMVKK